jgi:hypothetical protein
MLAAFLANLEPPRGTILHEKRSASLRDVEKAAQQIQDVLFPSVVPGSVKVKVKRALERVYEYNELPTVDLPRLDRALKETQEAIQAAQGLMQDLGEPVWLIEMRTTLSALVLIAAALNDDEEALLLLM